MKKDDVIALLRKQESKLNEKEFDLEPWKSYTSSILERIFGANSRKISQIQSLEYHFGSWSLRDTSGENSYILSCKKNARAIIEASIDELEIFGLPKAEEKSKVDAEEIVLSVIASNGGELVAANIKKIAHDNIDQETKVQSIQAELNYFSEDSLKKILTEFIIEL